MEADLQLLGDGRHIEVGDSAFAAFDPLYLPDGQAAAGCELRLRQAFLLP